MPGFQQKITRHAERQKKIQSEQVKQALESVRYDRVWNYHTEFKSTMVNMLRTLMEEMYSMQEQRSNVNREMETLKEECKGNAGNQKYCNRNVECL